jgi:SAM-dependent methyltransferase
LDDPTGWTLTPPLSVHAWLRFAAIRRLLTEVEARTVLEIGVGEGSVGVLLARTYDYTGVDVDLQSLSTARKRFERHSLDVSRLLHGGPETVGERRFDLVCAFEVLEHLQDDRLALTDWGRLVAPGGAVIVSVPAGPGRYGKADAKAGHFRRYSRSDAEPLLSSAGFARIRILNYGVPAGYALERARNVLATRQLRRRLTPEERTLESGRWLQPPAALARVTQAAAVPLAAIQRPFMNMDKGTGLVALGFRDPLTG